MGSGRSDPVQMGWGAEGGGSQRGVWKRVGKVGVEGALRLDGRKPPPGPWALLAAPPPPGYRAPCKAAISSGNRDQWWLGGDAQARVTRRHMVAPDHNHRRAVVCTTVPPLLGLCAIQTAKARCGTRPVGCVRARAGVGRRSALCTCHALGIPTHPFQMTERLRCDVPLTSSRRGKPL